VLQHCRKGGTSPVLLALTLCVALRKRLLLPTQQQLLLLQVLLL
jgi:hypothetical protein